MLSSIQVVFIKTDKLYNKILFILQEGEFPNIQDAILSKTMSTLLIRSLGKCYHSYRLSHLSVRSLGTTLIVQQKQKPRTDSAISTSSGSDRTDVSTDVRPLGERIKENTKTASYFGVIVFGVGVTGIIAFVIFRELFSSSSPNNIYSDALKDCINVSMM